MGLKRDLSYYEHFYKYISDTIYTLDLSGYFTSVNPAGEKLIGFSSEKIVGMHFAQIVSPEYIEVVKEKIKEKFKTGKDTIYELELIRADKRKIIVETHSSLIYRDGKPAEILGIAREITERKLLERQKEVFLSLVTHELKNPLTSIKGFSQLLQKKDVLTKKRQQYASIIEEQVNHLISLTNDFLEVSKINAGKFTINKRKTNISKLVDEVVETYRTTINSHKIKKISPRTIPIVLDIKRIKQVITNLISNAVKYSPENTDILITVEKNLEENHVLVSVQDSGPGIARSNQKHLFELFYRAKGHLHISGHGLGLYICKQIIEEHKGKIWVTSKKNRGTIFSFTLPLS